MQETETKTIICDRKLCIGCGNCVNVCPTGSISLNTDTEGFLKAEVNRESCIDCGACGAVCPPLKMDLDKNPGLEFYAATASDKIRCKSSSGGMFRLLADRVLSEDGYVCGSIWNEDFSARHILSNKMSDIEKMMGSKYMQSFLGSVFVDIKEKLDNGFSVMFSGTPCQCAALKSFLGKEYEKLLCVDLICHGVPSSWLLPRYLKESFPEREVKKVSFRQKKVAGWGTTMYVQFSDGRVFWQSADQDLWWKIFNENLCLGTQCGKNCQYNLRERVSDITIGDFWGVLNDEKLNAEINDGQGLSVLVTRTSNGQKAVENIGNDFNIRKPLDEILAGTGNMLDKTNTVNVSARKRFLRAVLAGQTLKAAYEQALPGRTDIGITGLWQGTNFGSILTYWSLYVALEDMGYYPSFIEYDGDIEGSGHEGFIWDHCRTTRVFHNKFDLYGTNDIFDTVIVGSDQCWRAGFTEKTEYRMFLDFVSDSVRKISYATSFAVPVYEGGESETRTVEKMLKRFDAISVREAAGKELLKNEFGIDGAWVADPVFLIDRKRLSFLAEEGRNSLGDGVIAVPYILVYCLDYNQDMREITRLLSKRMKCKVLLCTSPGEKTSKDWGDVITVSTLPEWLALIDGAEWVVTDSFHGTCVSIILHKQFNTYINLQRGAERFYSLFDKTGLGMRAFQADDLSLFAHLDTADHIDWAVVDKKLNVFRDYSIKWLQESLIIPKTKGETYEELSRGRLIRTISKLYSAEKEKTPSLQDKIIAYYSDRIEIGMRIAIRGGGGHTWMLLGLLKKLFMEKNVNIVYVIDNAKPLFQGIESVTAEEFYNNELYKSVDRIVVSSAALEKVFRDEIIKRGLSEMLLDQYEVLRDDLAPGQAWYEAYERL